MDVFEEEPIPKASLIVTLTFSQNTMANANPEAKPELESPCNRFKKGVLISFDIGEGLLRPKKERFDKVSGLFNSYQSAANPKGLSPQATCFPNRTIVILQENPLPWGENASSPNLILTPTIIKP